MQSLHKQSPSNPRPLALSNPNLRLYFAGQVVSLIGTWMQQMALSWLIYRLTNSAFMLGMIGCVTMAPSILLTPFAGILADRVNRHRLVLATQTLAMIQAGILAAVALSGHAQIWQLIALGAFMGIINAFDMPARQTFIVDMLRTPDELPNAIAVNSSIVTLTRLIGPTVAGICIAVVGEGMCFLINALSYVAVIVALLFVKAKSNSSVPSGKSPLAEIKEGFAYAFGFRPIRDLLVLLGLVSLFGMPYAVLMPAFARDVFHGNATTLGWLTAASGLGSLLGASYLATRKGVRGLGLWIFIATALFGVGLAGFGLSHWLPLSLVMLIAVGFGGMVQMAASNTILQTIVAEDKRGRVMSMYTMAFLGLAPIGSMAAGALATQVGTGPTVVGAGLICVVLSVVFGARLKGLRQEVRPIYIERGIISAENEMQIMNS